MKQWKSPDFNELNIENTSWLDDLFDDDFLNDDFLKDWECHMDKFGNVLHGLEQIMGGHLHKPSQPTEHLS